MTVTWSLLATLLPPLLSGASPSATAPAAPPPAVVAGPYVHVRLSGDVDLGMAPLVKRAFEVAQERGAKGVLLEVDTFGGRLDAAVLIRDTILGSDLPSTCYVNKRAISAGALACMAALHVDMAPGATIGAATPVQVDPTGKASAVDEKMTSYVRKEFAATAEARHRRKDIAEAMVDRDVAIEGVVAAGKLLTLTTDEALKVGLAERSSPTSADAATAAGFRAAEAIDVQMNWAEKLARLISNPIISGMLLTIGFLGIVVELKSPGWGPGVVGASALALFFFGHRVVMLAGWEDVMLAVAGIVLVALEIFVIPGFGVAGILGLVCLGAGVLLAMIGRNWDVAMAAGTVHDAVLALSSAVVLSAIGVALAVRYLPQSRFARRTLVLGTTLDTSAGTAAYAHDLSRFVGKLGIARTVLRPAGTVVVDEERIDAVSEGEVIPAATGIEVVAVRGAAVVVRVARGDERANAAPPPGAAPRE